METDFENGIFKAALAEIIPILMVMGCKIPHSFYVHTCHAVTNSEHNIEFCNNLIIQLCIYIFLSSFSLSLSKFIHFMWMSVCVCECAHFCQMLALPTRSCQPNSAQPAPDAMRHPLKHGTIRKSVNRRFFSPKHFIHRCWHAFLCIIWFTKCCHHIEQPMNNGLFVSLQSAKCRQINQIQFILSKDIFQRFLHFPWEFWKLHMHNAESTLTNISYGNANGEKRASEKKKLNFTHNTIYKYIFIFYLSENFI